MRKGVRFYAGEHGYLLQKHNYMLGECGYRLEEHDLKSEEYIYMVEERGYGRLILLATMFDWQLTYIHSRKCTHFAWIKNN